MLFVLIMLAENAYGIEDPTRPHGLEDARAQSLLTREPELSSILFSQDRKWAVIDGEVLSEGERINGFELSAIHRHSVVLVRNNKNIRLSIMEDGFDGKDI